jgi:uncharacterized membrane protein YdbT with pleckstrin-like domain
MDWFVEREVKLEPGETLVDDWRESKLMLLWRLLGPLALALFLIVLFFSSMDRATSLESIVFTFLLPASVVTVAWVSLVILQWYMRIFVLTSLRLIRREGVLRVNRVQTQLPKVQNASYALSGVQKWLGLGKVTVETASMGPPLTIGLVRGVPAIAALVLEASETAKRQTSHLDEPEIRQLLSQRLTTSM